MRRTELFGRPGIRPNMLRARSVTPPPSRWEARLRSFGGWLMSSRFAPLRSLGGRLLRTGALFSWLPK